MNTTPNGVTPNGANSMGTGQNGDAPKKRRAVRRVPVESADRGAEVREQTAKAPAPRTQPQPAQMPSNMQTRVMPVPKSQNAMQNSTVQRPQQNSVQNEPRSVPRPAVTSAAPPAQNRSVPQTSALGQPDPAPNRISSTQGQASKPAALPKRAAANPGQTSPSVRRNQPAESRSPSAVGIEYVNVKRPASAPENAERPSQAQPVKAAEAKPEMKASAGKSKKKKVRYVGGSTLSSLLKAIIYIMVVLVISGFLSYYIIIIANDVFAFVKPTEEIAVQIEENATIDDIADELYEEGVIEYPSIFKLYTRIRRNLEDVEFVAGEHMVSTSMNYDYLYKAFLPKVTRSIERITIPEGYTVDEIIDLFISYGMGTREGFVDAIQNGDFSDYWFIAELDANISPDRKYRLEGYLFPDTYEFYTDWSETQILRKLLDNFATKFDIAYKERCDELGMTVDEIVILASMIQMEAKYAEEYGSISSVFHNRLKSDVFMKRLDSDATIQYALGADRKSELSGEDTKLNSPYNTYTNSGLPPGPISNPSLNAISYALYPDKTEYYYFVAKSNGYSLFATTEEEHLANIRIARGE